MRQKLMAESIIDAMVNRYRLMGGSGWYVEVHPKDYADLIKSDDFTIGWDDSGKCLQMLFCREVPITPNRDVQVGDIRMRNMRAEAS